VGKEPLSEEQFREFSDLFHKKLEWFHALKSSNKFKNPVLLDLVKGRAGSYGKVKVSLLKLRKNEKEICSAKHLTKVILKSDARK